MNSEKIYDALTNVREDFIVEAKEHRLRKSRKSIISLCAVAASLVLIIGIGSYLFMNDQLPAPGGNQGGGGRQDGATTFMSYAGPVFPLTVSGDTDGVTASRDITFDFSGFGETTKDENGAVLVGHSDVMVSDDYILTNDTATEKNMRIFYPFASNFADLHWMRPTVTIENTALDTELVAGFYSGGFTGIEGLEDDRVNLKYINSWDEYVMLLSDGEYLRRALGDMAKHDQIVTVYEFTNVQADHNKAVAPTLAAEFNLDYDKTNIMTFGFNGTEWDIDNGFMRRSFFVPKEGSRGYGHSRYMVVVGDDISDLTMQGYQNGGCHAGEEMDVTTDMTRYEMPLGDFLALLLDEYMTVYYGFNYGDRTPAGNLDMAMLYRSVVELLFEYGLMSDNAAWRYTTGVLEDIFSETLNMNRVFYLSAEITIPAEESVVINVNMIKPGSFDFYGAGSSNVGIYGYDMLTQLDGSLVFSGQSAGIAGAERIEIVRQNFGFDLGNGVLNVSLDLNLPHYYLEVRVAARAME